VDLGGGAHLRNWRAPQRVVASSNVATLGTMLQAESFGVRIPFRSFDYFPTDLILHTALWPLVNSTSKRNVNQESSSEVKGGRRLNLTNAPPSLSQLSGKCENLDVSQLYTYINIAFHGSVS
jgi:hypothetical protein